MKRYKAEIMNETRERKYPSGTNGRGVTSDGRSFLMATPTTSGVDRFSVYDSNTWPTSEVVGVAIG